MNCKLSTLDVAPVALGFNCETHSAPAYKLNHFAKDISAVGDGVSVEFVLHMRRNCYFELPITIPTLPSDSATRFPIRNRCFADWWALTMRP